MNHITVINSWELEADDPMKDEILQMNSREEIELVKSAKKTLLDKRVTVKNVRDRLTEFMSMWEPNTRKFPIINAYLETLSG